MKKHKTLIILVLHVVLLTTSATNLLAHEGGHHRSNKDRYNTWEYREGGKTFKGNFMMFKEDKIFFELPNGEIKAVSLNDLSEMDKRIAEIKLHQLQHINTSNSLPLPIPVKAESSWNYQVLLSLSFISMLGCLLLVLSYRLYQASEKENKHWKIGMASLSLVGLIAFASACKKESSDIIAMLKTDPLLIDAAFTPYKPAVTTSWDDSYFYVSSNGIPSHNMMVGITSWQQQVPLPQSYAGSNSWSIPLNPVLADNTLSIETNFMKGAIAIAENGIPIFNPLNNRGEDAYKFGELDNWGGHCGKADDYHYHTAPLHLESISGNKPIAFALDGFPVYGSKEPDGSTMNALDQYHGHTGADGVYHYHGTTSYPYMIGAMRGKVTLDPTTKAPENQIIPQAKNQGIRPPLTPLNGAMITNFSSNGTNAYSLEYTINSKKGYVNYSWNSTSLYTFNFIDTEGKATKETYQK